MVEKLCVVTANNDFLANTCFFFNCGTYAAWKVKIRCSVHLYFNLFVGGRMSYLRYLCLFVYSGVQHMLCCVFALFFFVLCTLCCQLLWIFHFWLTVRYSRTFILYKLKHFEYHKLMLDEIKSTDIQAHIYSPLTESFMPCTLKSWQHMSFYRTSASAVSAYHY